MLAIKQLLNLKTKNNTKKKKKDQNPLKPRKAPKQIVNNQQRLSVEDNLSSIAQDRIKAFEQEIF